MGACRIRRGCVAAAVASAADPELYTQSSELYQEGSGCSSWSSSSPSISSTALSQLFLPAPLSLQTGAAQTDAAAAAAESPPQRTAFPGCLQHQRPATAFPSSGGGADGRVFQFNTIEFQARAIIWLAEHEMERTMRGGSNHNHRCSRPLPLPPDAVAHWQLANPGVASVRKSLHWFLQRRKARIRATATAAVVSPYPLHHRRGDNKCH